MDKKKYCKEGAEFAERVAGLERENGRLRDFIRAHHPCAVDCSDGCGGEVASAGIICGTRG